MIEQMQKQVDELYGYTDSLRMAVDQLWAHTAPPPPANPPPAGQVLQ
jgi:hypothetical protein